MKAGKFISTYLKAIDIKAPQVVTIRAVKQEQVGLGTNATNKAIMYFSELEQGVVMNKTNLNMCVSMFGDEMDAWVGKKVLLMVEPVMFQGNMVPGIKIKAP